ncbi:aspartate/glutamate racemase family protein [Reyranella soli]|uniref:Arylsulfatase n=1 Tax=Reyranella soli TaxID=1230389 RepID=A0A512N6F1_9HYPH|nr:aspartate/glutamate racemase family protein [Reyranella soli]GEP54565.1 arylsulfatase [Reyranella soli]
MTRIALVHATPAAVDPIKQAFAKAWPEPDLVNLLDDSLSRDRALTPQLTDGIFGRFDALGRYAVSLGADAILFTCSAFGPAIERVARSVTMPVLKPNEAMFAEAIAIGGTIGMLATFEPSIASMSEEFEDQAKQAGASASLKSVFVPGAMAALLAGGREQHDILVAEAAAQLGGCDAIMLAQFSMAPAAARLRSRSSVPVLTSPASAVAVLKSRLAA